MNRRLSVVVVALSWLLGGPTLLNHLLLSLPSSSRIDSLQQVHVFRCLLIRFSSKMSSRDTGVEEEREDLFSRILLVIYPLLL